MIEKVWVVYREEDMDKVKIYDDTVYLSEDEANRVAKELNRGSIYEYYVDCLGVDYN